MNSNESARSSASGFSEGCVVSKHYPRDISDTSFASSAMASLQPTLASTSAKPFAVSQAQVLRRKNDVMDERNGSFIISGAFSDRQNDGGLDDNTIVSVPGEGNHVKGITDEKNLTSFSDLKESTLENKLLQSEVVHVNESFRGQQAANQLVHNANGLANNGSLLEESLMDQSEINLDALKRIDEEFSDFSAPEFDDSDEEVADGDEKRAGEDHCSSPSKAANAKAQGSQLSSQRGLASETNGSNSNQLYFTASTDRALYQTARSAPSYSDAAATSMAPNEFAPSSEMPPSNFDFPVECSSAASSFISASVFGNPNASSKSANNNNNNNNNTSGDSFGLSRLDNNGFSPPEASFPGGSHFATDSMRKERSPLVTNPFVPDASLAEDFQFSGNFGAGEFPSFEFREQSEFEKEQFIAQEEEENADRFRFMQDDLMNVSANKQLPPNGSWHPVENYSSFLSGIQTGIDLSYFGGGVPLHDSLGACRRRPDDRPSFGFDQSIRSPYPKAPKAIISPVYTNDSSRSTTRSQPSPTNIVSPASFLVSALSSANTSTPVSTASVVPSSEISKTHVDLDRTLTNSETQQQQRSANGSASNSQSFLGSLRSSSQKVPSALSKNAAFVIDRGSSEVAGTCEAIKRSAELSRCSSLRDERRKAPLEGTAACAALQASQNFSGFRLPHEVSNGQPKHASANRTSLEQQQQYRNSSESDNQRQHGPKDAATANSSALNLSSNTSSTSFLRDILSSGSSAGDETTNALLEEICKANRLLKQTEAMAFPSPLCGKAREDVAAQNGTLNATPVAPTVTRKRSQSKTSSEVIVGDRRRSSASVSSSGLNGLETTAAGKTVGKVEAIASDTAVPSKTTAAVTTTTAAIPPSATSSREAVKQRNSDPQKACRLTENNVSLNMSAKRPVLREKTTDEALISTKRDALPASLAKGKNTSSRVVEESVQPFAPETPHHASSVAEAEVFKVPFVPATIRRNPSKKAIAPATTQVQQQQQQQNKENFCPRENVSYAQSVSETTSICTSASSASVAVQNKLLANKHRLYFGCAELQSTASQTVTLRNATTDELIRLELKIKDVPFVSSAFKIVGDHSCLLLHPGEEYSLGVAFRPASVGTFRTKLLLKGSHFKQPFSIDLCGFGGIAKLLLVNPDETKGSFARMYVRSGMHGVEERSRTLLLRNTGIVDGFFKIVAFKDEAGGEVSHDSISVEPSAFVLKPSETKVVSIGFLCTAEAWAGLSQSQVLGQISVRYGEEILRQQFKRYTKSRGIAAIVNGVNYGDLFMNEQDMDLQLKELAPIKPSSSDLAIFEVSVREQCVQLCAKIAEPDYRFLRTPANVTFAPLCFDSTMFNQTAAASPFAPHSCMKPPSNGVATTTARGTRPNDDSAKRSSSDITTPTNRKCSEQKQTMRSLSDDSAAGGLATSSKPVLTASKAERRRDSDTSQKSVASSALQSTQEKLQFGTTPVGSISVQKLNIRNPQLKDTKVVFSLTCSAAKAFRVKHDVYVIKYVTMEELLHVLHSCEPNELQKENCYINMPVTFAPTAPGTHHGEIIAMDTDSGKQLRFAVSGVAVITAT